MHRYKKTPCRAGWGECGSQGYTALPPLPLEPAGPRLWRLSPQGRMCSAHALLVPGSRPVSGQPRPDRPERVSQRGHFPRPNPQSSTLAWTPIAGQGTELVLKWVRSSGSQPRRGQNVSGGVASTAPRSSRIKVRGPWPESLWVAGLGRRRKG